MDKQKERNYKSCWADDQEIPKYMRGSSLVKHETPNDEVKHASILPKFDLIFWGATFPNAVEHEDVKGIAEYKGGNNNEDRKCKFLSCTFHVYIIKDEVCLSH